jgi:predicted ATPase/class 3 adenylate cyclase
VVSAAPQPTGTVTLVFTDIEGSTRLLEEMGTEAYREALARHRTVVRSACARHSGYEVDYEGDAFFYAFPTPGQAVAAVTEVMLGLDGGPIRIRVGIHTGGPALDPPKYVGIDVHRAARIMAAAHGGQVVLSQSTVDLLPDGSAELVDLGDHRFKDLGTPERVHQLVVEGLEREFPRLRSLYRVMLPVPATPFLGREKELEQVVERLSAPGTRLLALTGPGGTGKTRLALQAAAETSDRFPDGVFWVPLAPVRDPALLVATIAQAVEVRDRPGEALADTLAAALLGKQTLLVVDNVEQLLPEAAGELAGLLDACPTLRAIVTSRERLRIPAEAVFAVPPMNDHDGVELFVQRARAAGVELDVDDDVRELCRRLDDLPLALELAAPRLLVFTPAELLGRLGQRLDLLGGDRGGDPRQRTLRTTMEWSYDLLTDRERRVYRTLGVFVGGCAIEAAEHVTGARPDDLQSLVDKNLVRSRATPEGRRFWMLETIREHACDALAASGETGSAHTAHDTYFEGVAETLLALGSNRPESLAVLRAEHANLRAALTRSIDDASVERAHLLARALAPYWWTRGSLTEAEELLRSLLAQPAGRDVVGRGRVLDGAASIASMHGDYALAEQRGREAVAVLERAGDPASLGIALSNLGGSFSFRDDRLDESVELLTRAIEILESTDNTDRVVPAYLNLGNTYLGLDRYRDAADAFSKGRDLALAVGVPRWIASAGIGLGECSYWLGELDQAYASLVEAASYGARLGDDDTVFNALDVLSIVAAELGAAEDALRARIVADRLAREAGHSLDPLYDERRTAADRRVRELLGDRLASIETEASLLTPEEVLAGIARPPVSDESPAPGQRPA